jgi:NADP-reducing hydrogenase subunit HndA
MDDNEGRDQNIAPAGGEETRPSLEGTAGQDLSSVRSGDLAPYERGEPPAPLVDATEITPARAIPPAELTVIMDRYRHVDPIEAMIPVLQEVQVKYGYLTQHAVEQMALELGISETEIYGVVTFYSFFRYSPRAGHVIMSCEGTGCYVRGAAKVREAIENRLDVGPGETTRDGMFTFEPQSICLGACDLGPLVDIEGTYYAHVTPEKMDAILTQWIEAGDEKPVGDNVTGGHAPHYEEAHGFGPSADELYEGYEVARFMPQGGGGGGAATATKAPSEVAQRVQDTPPTPGQPGRGS